MPNGRPGDHPLTDGLVHGREVYSPRATYLIQSIAKLADEKTLRDLGDVLFTKFNEYSSPDIPGLEGHLTELHDRLLRDGRGRGFEIDE
jgi:hypothetical protein